MPYKNREDQRKAWREWYHRNKTSHRAVCKAQKQSCLDVMRSAKESPCADCGEVYPHYVMDFDHVRGKKLFDIANATRFVLWEKRLKLLEEEFKKCDVVCSNCHRERTFGKSVRTRLEAQDIDVRM